MTEYMKPGPLGLAAVAVIGLAGPMGLAAGLRAHSWRPMQTAAATFASRFPSGEIAPSRVAPSDVVPTEVAEAGSAPAVFSPVLWREPWLLASNSPYERELFSPVPSYPAAAAVTGTPARSAGPEAEGGLRTDAVRHRTAYRPKSVFNDAQIASIKERLNLTPEQQAMWPPVEAALRKISYVGNPADAQNRRAQQSSARLAFIDPDSAELRQLKYAALPLFMRLNDEQKREVNLLAYVMGLSKVAPE
jgi:hypothetical protein